MTNNRDYLKAMNKLDEQLPLSDKKYFTDLRAYMALSGFVVEEKAVNEQIYQMYLDFIHAEEEDLTATDYFGNEPKEMADELLENLPKAPFKNIIQYTAIVAGILWGMRLVSDFSTSSQVTINPALYLFDVLIGGANILVLFKLIKNNIYSKRNQLLEGIIALVAFMFFVVLYIRAELFVPEVFTFVLPFPWDMLLIAGLGLIVFLTILISKEQAFYSVGFSILFFVTIGVLNRYEIASNISLPLFAKLVTLILIGTGFYFANKYLKKD